jgi:hypothetical protein
MKRMILLAALAMATAAWAQAPAPKKEPAKPAAASEAAKPAMEQAAKEPGSAQAKKPSAKKSASRRQQDARHCLERGSNMEIIKCAEEYL